MRAFWFDIQTFLEWFFLFHFIKKTTASKWNVGPKILLQSFYYCNFNMYVCHDCNLYTLLLMRNSKPRDNVARSFLDQLFVYYATIARVAITSHVASSHSWLRRLHNETISDVAKVHSWISCSLMTQYDNSVYFVNWNIPEAVFCTMG